MMPNFGANSDTQSPEFPQMSVNTSSVNSAVKRSSSKQQQSSIPDSTSSVVSSMQKPELIPEALLDPSVLNAQIASAASAPGDSFDKNEKVLHLQQQVVQAFFTSNHLQLQSLQQIKKLVLYRFKDILWLALPLEIIFFCEKISLKSEG